MAAGRENPGTHQPQSRGKQERLGRYIRERFLIEAEAQGISSFQGINDRFMAWAEQVCNTRQPAETGQTPIERFTSHGPLHAVDRRCCAKRSAGRSCGG